MKLLLEDDLESLVLERQEPCVSIYFPTPHSGARAPQGPIYLKNLLGRARAEMSAQGIADSTAEAVLAPAEDLLRDRSFWLSQEDGAALFCSPGFFRAFRLPLAFRERCAVGRHFVLKPLLPLVARDDSFYVLALSQHEVRLLEATCRTVRRIGARDLPGSRVEAVGGEKTPQYLQYHTATSSRAGISAIYHGHGVGEEDTKQETRRFLRQVETAVRKLLAGRTAPLVLAGVEPLPALFQEISHYPHLAAEPIAGNPGHSSDEELRDRAWKLLEPEFQEARRRAADRFRSLAGTGLASNDVVEILPAARQGRVQALFLACDTELWGQPDGPKAGAEIHPSPQEGDEDLLDSAALLSLRKGAAVYGVGRAEVPGGGDLAAVFRY